MVRRKLSRRIVGRELAAVLHGEHAEPDAMMLDGPVLLAADRVLEVPRIQVTPGATSRHADHHIGLGAPQAPETPAPDAAPRYAAPTRRRCRGR